MQPPLPYKVPYKQQHRVRNGGTLEKIDRSVPVKDCDIVALWKDCCGHRRRNASDTQEQSVTWTGADYFGAIVFQPCAAMNMDDFPWVQQIISRKRTPVPSAIVTQDRYSPECWNPSEPSFGGLRSYLLPISQKPHANIEQRRKIILLQSTYVTNFYHINL